MRTSSLSFVVKLFNDQSGQVMFWAVGGMLALLGVAGLTLDVGHAYMVRSQLQNSANAAVLAAAGVVYNTSATNNATTFANEYSASTSDKNVYTNLGTVTTTVTTKCLNSLLPSGSACGSSTAANAVQVTNTVSVPTWFMQLFGVKTITVGATATATMQGIAQPWNVAIIVDATGSMSTADSDCGGVSEFQCAMNGVQALLQTTNPCPSGVSSCSGTGANFRVSLFSFPGVSTSTVSDDSTNCNATPNYMMYTLPLPTATSYTPLTYSTSGSHPVSWTATYQIVGFSSDYYQPTASNGLNPNSALVEAVTGCMTPITAPGSGTGGLNGAPSSSGGGITYYAGTIYAAQAALLAEQAANPGSKNAIIFLSDGQANLPASANDLPSEQSYSIPAANGLYTLTGNGSYPDIKDQCQQAIAAAQAATAAGTTVYSVAYGSEDTGCGSGSGHTDTTLSLTNQAGFNAPFTLSTLTPCVTMENIASSLATFYSDYNQSGSGSTCQDASHTVVSLQDIFLSIGANFTTPRLVPNNSK
ncbi:MAG: pilus assembly protein TadG-related protein [Terracidiphilus sp.]|jgi:hypothetical protein